MEENEEKKEGLLKRVNEQVEEKINNIIDSGVTPENVKILGDLVDIHKDIANEEYWKKKEEVYKMRYMREDYGDDYGRRGRDSKGRYMGNRRGESYRGQMVLDEMYDGYRNYSDGREEYNRGNYGAKGETMRSLEYMLGSVTDFIEMLQNDAGSQEEVDMIKKYTRRISEM